MSKDTNTSAAGREGGTRRAGETFLKRERERERWGWVLGTLVSELLFPGINNVTLVPGCIPASTNVRMTHLYRVDTPQYKCGTFVSGGMSHPDLRTNSNARIH